MNKVLVIGDSCEDVFIYGDIERICPEAPVPVFTPTHTTKNPIGLNRKKISKKGTILLWTELSLKNFLIILPIYTQIS